MNLYRGISEERRKQEVFHYIQQNPNCEIKDVIQYLTINKLGSNNTVRHIIKQWLKTGILNDGKTQDKLKSFKLTIVEDNPFLILPHELKVITYKLKKFIREVKRLRSEKFEIHYKEVNPSIFERIDQEEVRQSLSYLPYSVISIIDQIYKFYFIFILPQKISKKSVVKDLYSIYFEFFTNLLILVSNELQNDNPFIEISVNEITKQNRQVVMSSMSGGFNYSSNLFRYCRILEIETHLYDILDFVWLNHITILPSLYYLKWDSKFLTYEQALRKFEAEYGDNIKRNEILKKIHVLIDYHIYWLEEIHWQGWDPYTNDDYFL
jgi:hypothetical protein